MDEIQTVENEKVFIYGDADVRVFEISGEPWFVGKDVADVLGYSNARDAIFKHVDNEDKSAVAIRDGRQNRNMTIINESALYSLIFGSKLESAKRFKKWVTSEVLPQIRRTGGYLSPAVESRISRLEESNRELAQAIAEIGKNISKAVSMSQGHRPRQMPEWKLTDAEAFAEDCLEFVQDSSEGAEVKVWAVFQAYRQWKETTRPWSATMGQSELTRALKTLYGIQEKQKRYQGDCGSYPNLIFLDVRLKSAAE